MSTITSVKKFRPMDAVHNAGNTKSEDTLRSGSPHGASLNDSANHSLPPRGDPARGQLILLEQVRAAYRQGYALLSHGLAAILLLTVLWGSLGRALMLGWFIFIGGVLTLYVRWYRAFNRLAPGPQESAPWARRRLIINAALGIGWAFAGLVLFPADDLAGQALLTMVMVGISAGSLAGSAAYLPANYAMVIPMLMALVVRTALVGDIEHVITAILLAIYLGYVLYGARTVNRLLTNSLRTRFENLDLIAALTAQTAAAEGARQEAEAANQAKSRLVDELTTQKAQAEGAQLAAEVANQAKSRFLAAASHDLRQPLHALGLFAGALTEKIHYPEVRHIVDNINASVQALEALFNELLDISKLDAGVIQPNLCHYSIQATLQRLASEYQVSALEKGVRLRIRPSNALVRSDPMLLERILRNLVANAIQYTKAGSILVACRRRSGWLRIEVRDSGIGIPHEQRDKIFEEFYQLHNPERDRNKGLGLGLAIVRRMSRLLGCQISLCSAPGRGSRFSIEVPAGDAAAQPPAPALPARTYRFDGDLVLVVDDELAVRESVQILLELWGCEVLTAGSAEEALQVLDDASPPALIIADYRLRCNATGIEAIQAVQAKFRANIPGVLITGDTGPDRLREAKTSGYQLVHKPVAPAKLRAILEPILKGERHGSD